MLLTSPGVTHVGAAFDHVIESFRNDLYAGCKTGEGVAPNLLGQFPLAEKAVSALGVVIWPMVKFEADDALATATARLRKSKRVEQIVICSPDTADGFPGIPGWGAKPASTVLARFEHIESIPDDPGRWDLKAISPGRTASLAESLAQRRDEANLYRQLATLRDDVPLKETLNELKWQGAYPRLKRLCHELGDDLIPECVPRWR
jgi:5'-3' exonuclease